MTGEKVPFMLRLLPTPGEKMEDASTVGVFEPELRAELGSEDVEANRFDMEVFVRRYGKEDMEEEGEVGRCLDSIDELPVSACSGALDWFGSSRGFIWPPPASSVVYYAL
jgi:hypothetical protein